LALVAGQAETFNLTSLRTSLWNCPAVAEETRATLAARCSGVDAVRPDVHFATRWMNGREFGWQRPTRFTD
jgi:hypothetical protein